MRRERPVRLRPIPAHELRVPIGRSRELDTTYSLAVSIVRGRGYIQSDLAPGPRRRPPRCLHHLVSRPAKEDGIGRVEVLDCVTMHVVVRDHFTMIAAPVQRDG